MQFKYLKYDLYRYFYPNDEVSERSFLRKVNLIMTRQGIWAIISYRFARWVLYECRFKPLRFLLKPIALVLHLFVQTITGILINPDIDIGPGFYIGHYGTIFMGGETKIGKFCNVSQGNTFGYAGRGENRGLPELGDFVYVAPGAKIIGKVKIGNHVAIGANAVVTKDLPDNAVAVGIPAKIISYDSSRPFVEFNKEKCREIL